MTVTIDCKVCEAIYHAKVKTFKTKEITAECPFCNAKEEIKLKDEN